MRSVHDMGGLSDGPVSPENHARESWEKRTDAIGMALRMKGGMIRLDELRRHVELLGDRYTSLAYGERTLHGLSQTLIEHGIITTAELAQAMERIDARGATDSESA